MKPAHIYTLFFIVTLFGMAALLSPETGNIRFERISIKEGLSQSSVRSILQDRRGFMWFGTVDGLNQYDGYGFNVRKPDPENADSLSSPFLRAIIEDHAGILWLGTNGRGLDRFDPLTEHFTHYRNNPHEPGSLSFDYVWDVYEDSAFRLWVGTDGGGLNKFDRETETFTPYRHDPGNPNSLSHNKVLCICEDRGGELWIGTRGGGLNKFNPGTGDFTRYRHEPGNPGGLGSDFVWDVYVDREGTAWIATDGGGLNKYDRENDTFIHYLHEPDNPHSISYNRLLSIYQDRESKLWIGTSGGGLNKFDPVSGHFTRYRHEFNNPNSLSDNYIYSIYEDKSGVLWFGTENGGINKLDRTREQFVHYRSTPDTLQELEDNSIWAIYEEPSGALWFGTRSCELVKMDRETETVTYYRHDPTNPNSLRSKNHIRAICPDGSEPGILWLGVDGGGLHKFDPASGVFSFFRHNPNDPTSLSSNRIYSIYEDKSGPLWVGTRTGGLNKMDRETGRFTRYRNDPNDPKSLSNDYVYVIHRDRLGILWVGTFAGGLNTFDDNTGTFFSYRSDVNDPGSLSSDCILCIHEDSAGDIWLGTGGGGLNRFHREDRRFTHYSEEHGMPNAVVYGILEDRGGNLWLSTNNGVSRFNPGTGKFKNYNEIDGLQSNEFNGAAYFNSPRTGEMFFGGINGLNAFFPERIKDNAHVPPIVITGFLKFNKEVKLPGPVSELKEITLSHRDYVFSFEFAALDFTVPAKNKYAYKMEGLGSQWITTGAWKRFATYTTLPPGEYTFRVKGSNNDGLWNEEGVSVKVIVTPPFWQTWWFRVFAAVIILLVSLLLYKRSIKNLSIRTRMETELQTAQKAQMAIMPQEDPGIRGFDISGLCIPAYEVGGDFFDYFWLDEEHSHFGIAVGDVSGKAMNAAMTAVMSSGIIFSKAYETRSIKDLMTQINKPIFFKTGKKMFTALCIVSIDINAKMMTFSNAGLNAPLRKSGDSVVKLESSGPRFPLGFRKNVRYKEETVQLKRGNIVVLFTDGISESLNTEDDFYGNERLNGLLERLDTSRLSAREVIGEIMDDINGFSGEMPRHDDMTVVVVKVL